MSNAMMKPDEDRIELYHYTTFESGFKILDSKCLWLFKSTALSDPLEVRYGMSCLLEALLNVADKKGEENLKQVGQLMALTCTLFRFSLSHELSSKRLEKYGLLVGEDGIVKYNGYIRNAFTQSMYLASFTEKRDDILQWRLYSANGTGLALQLKVPVGQTKIMLSENASKWLHCLQVTYAERKQAIDKFENMISTYLAEQQPLPEIARSCWNHAVSIKQEDYKHEAEWRIVVYYKNEALEQQYLTTADRLRPYIKMPITNGEDSGILVLIEIMTGPRSTFDGSIDDDWKKFVDSRLPDVTTTHSGKQLR